MARPARFERATPRFVVLRGWLNGAGIGRRRVPEGANRCAWRNLCETEPASMERRRETYSRYAREHTHTRPWPHARPG